MGLLTFHVQDRTYTAKEVKSLITNYNDPFEYKHLTLSGGSPFYSVGTMTESFSTVIGLPFIVLGTIATAFAGIAVAIDHPKSAEKTINNLYNASPSAKELGQHLNKAFGPSPSHNIGQESYTGKEITAFLNEYEKLGLDRAFNIHVGDHIINKFLSHGFINAEVPTLDNYHGEYAVLDVKSLVEPIDHHIDHI